MLADHADRRRNDFWDGADLVMEVVSQNVESRRRDLERKRTDYAEARIPEYWFVDPIEQQITVLQLEGDTFVAHGPFKADAQVHSLLLDGFSIDVARLFQAAEA